MLKYSVILLLILNFGFCKSDIFKLKFHLLANFEEELSNGGKKTKSFYYTSEFEVNFLEFLFFSCCKKLILNLFVQSTWLESVRVCKTFGMDLARFDSATEQSNFIAAAQKKLPSKWPFYYWLAGSDIVEKNNWRWAPDDTPINFNLAWAPEQPNNHHNVACLSTRAYSQFQLVAYDCNFIVPFICQRVQSSA